MFLLKYECSVFHRDQALSSHLCCLIMYMVWIEKCIQSRQGQWNIWKPFHILRMLVLSSEMLGVGHEITMSVLRNTGWLMRVFQFYMTVAGQICNLFTAMNGYDVLSEIEEMCQVKILAALTIMLQPV